MPDDGLTRIEEIYNQLVKSGTASLRNLNAREQARSALVGAIRDFIKKNAEKQPGSEQYIDEFAKGVAGAVFETEPLQQSFKSVQEMLKDVSSYLEERLVIAPRMRAAADGIAGRTVPPNQIESTQNLVHSSALVARTLDDRLQLKVKQKFSFSPKVVLDPTVSFIRKVDAAYQVTITQFDATVRVQTGFSIDRPLTSSASIDAFAGIELSPRPGLSAYVKGTTHFDDLYSRPQMTSSKLTAGLQAQLNPNTTLNLDYTANNPFGGTSRPEHQVVFGIKIRF